MAAIFPNWIKTINPQVQGVQRTPSRINKVIATPRHILVKLPKTNDKEKNLNSCQEKKDTWYMKQQRIVPDFSLETIQPRRKWKKNLQISER